MSLSALRSKLASRKSPPLASPEQLPPERVSSDRPPRDARPSSSATRLPPELILKILRFVTDELGSFSARSAQLCDLSLVARSWRPPAQAELWRVIRVDLDRFSLSRIHESPACGRFVTERVTLLGANPPRHLRPCRAPSPPTSLQRLRRRVFGPEKQASEFELAEELFTRLRGVRELVLDGNYLQKAVEPALLGLPAFADLTSLKLGHGTLFRHDESSAALLRSLTFRLRTLEVAGFSTRDDPYLDRDCVQTRRVLRHLLEAAVPHLDLRLSHFGAEESAFFLVPVLPRVAGKLHTLGLRDVESFPWASVRTSAHLSRALVQRPDTLHELLQQELPSLTSIAAPVSAIPLLMASWDSAAVQRIQKIELWRTEEDLREVAQFGGLALHLLCQDQGVALSWKVGDGPLVWDCGL